MLPWTIFALLTAAVVAALLAPFRRTRTHDEPGRADYNRAVFRDQLTEVDRDLERGLIGKTEAEAARNEIARRLIQAGPGGTQPQVKNASRAVPILAAVLVPLVAVPLYLRLGRPQLPDVPHAERLANAAENGDFAGLVAKVEARLAEKPDDVQGWIVLAPAYKRMERWADAAEAYANILRLKPVTAEALADYAEMAVYAKEGMVTADARKAFSQAVELDPKLPKARFFLALALKQEGKTEEAKSAFTALLADAPADAAWRSMVEAELKGDASSAMAMTGDQQQAAAGMTPGDRAKMIRSMVEGLEAKLKANGDNLDGWLQLIRARTVLNEQEKAKAALTAARLQFKDRPEALSSLDGLVKELGL